MDNELLLLIKKHTGTLIEQTKPKPQEVLAIKLNKQLETFCFSPPKNISDEGKLFIAVTFVEATTSVFKITDENNSF